MWWRPTFIKVQSLNLRTVGPGPDALYFSDFWDIGHKLFKSTPESFPAKFIAGDILDPSHLAASDHQNPDESFETIPPLQSLTSLNPLRGHVSVIHALSFFHLFDEPGQRQLARLFAGLLDPRPGSMIFGGHGGMPQKGLSGYTFSDRQLFCHSPESWAELWDGEIFEKGTVRVTARLIPVNLPREGDERGTEYKMLIWSIVRL
jgi:hypothetical protein